MRKRPTSYPSSLAKLSMMSVVRWTKEALLAPVILCSIRFLPSTRIHTSLYIWFMIFRASYFYSIRNYDNVRNEDTGDPYSKIAVVTLCWRCTFIRSYIYIYLLCTNTTWTYIYFIQCDILILCLMLFFTTIIVIIIGIVVCYYSPWSPHSRGDQRPRTEAGVASTEIQQTWLIARGN